MITQFNRFEIEMTEEQARNASHPGPCDDDVKALSELPEIVSQMQAIDHESIRKELAEYGAWDDEELADDEQNIQRILWIAAGDIVAELPTPNKYFG